MEPSEALAGALASIEKVAVSQLTWMTEATALIEQLQREVAVLMERVARVEGRSA